MNPEDWDLRQMTEGELKAKVLEIARKNGWMVFHLSKDQRARNAYNGNGYPDLTLARDKEVLFIELKRQVEGLEADQVRWQLALPAYHVVRPSDLESGRVMELLG